MKKFVFVLFVSIVFLPVFLHAFTIGLVLGNMDNPYFVTMANAAEEQAKLLGIDITVLDANYDSATQHSQVENLLQRNVDAIVINPTDSKALIPAAEAAYEAGVPFVCIDRTVDSELISLDIESDNYMAGKLAAEYVADRLNGKGKIAIIYGTPGLSVMRERTDGFMDEIKKYSNIEIVAEQNGDFNMADGMAAAEAILTAHPHEIDAIYAENDPMALGTVQALKMFNYEKDEIFIVAVDASPAGLDAMQKGDYIAFEAGQQPRKMTAMAVTAAYLLAEDFKIETPDGSKRYFMEVVPVTIDNVDEWLETSVDGWH
ncbi:D-ribose transporter subunit RbsB [Petrotoga miotherma DSM 10691]|uniref:D-ribose transporter subunit RbsB n=1 Tax=Petrotoga miotherma DSM 10691 TaxID=1434326 RepID=A0A2K1PEP3_9BACT|nr:sugar ABC transporter substrate-binding protein [Petrotoga miotherma]MDN5345773.1 ribose transport system substrate-binding protein [Petrotoga sp.]PNS01245.1 D-ribose transporter subunit RbsB [Petrotoga miotherma DSM 10691]